MFPAHAEALDLNAIEVEGPTHGHPASATTTTSFAPAVTAPLGPSRRFEILRCIGAGGMGVVYEAVDRDRHIRVALKTMRSFSPEGLLRFKREFRALSDLRHPNLVTLGELFEERGQWFFTMELVEGVDFLSYVRCPMFDDARLRGALRGIAQGLDCLHRAGLVHRDVKPSNLLITSAGRAVLLDFGLVFDAASGEAAESGIGTRAYMAPEQAAGATITPAADWYSVGVLLHEALVGEKPGQTPHPDRAIPPDLDALCKALLSADPRRRPTGAEVLAWIEGGPSASTTSPPARSTFFVGRTAELGMLQAAWREVQRGQGQATVLLGESGIGKSAIVAELVRRVGEEEPDLLTLVGRCAARESVPFKAVDGIVDGIVQHLRGLRSCDTPRPPPELVATLGRAFPVLCRLGGAASSASDEADIDPREQRLRLFAAMRDLLHHLATRGPLLVIVEDLHWADADSIALLAEVMREPVRPRILLLATARADNDGVALRLPVLLDARPIRLGPMPQAEAEAFAARHLGADASPERARAIATEAGGHPFFMAELSRHGGTSWPAASGNVDPVSRLQSVIEERVARLETGAAGVLELVAVAGMPIALPLVADAAAVDAEPLLPRLASLEFERLIRRTHASGDAIEPYHDRIRDVVLARLTPAARSERHRRLAQVFEVATPDAAEALAVQWQGAGDAERAMFHAERAAARAVEMLAFAQGARLYRMALDLLPTGSPRQTELSRRLAEALALAGRGPEAGEAFLVAAAGELPDSEAMRELEWRAADQFLRSGHITRGLALSRRVLDHVGISMPTSATGAVASYAVQRARVRLRGVGFRPRDERDIPPAELHRLDVIWPVICGLLTCDPVRAGDLMARYFRWALDAGEPYRIMRGLAAEAGFAALDGPSGRRRAARLLDMARTIAADTDGTWVRGGISMASGVLAIAAGQLAAARAMFEDAETSVRSRRPSRLGASGAEASDITWELDMPCAYHLITLWLLGDLRSLNERVSALGAEARERGDRFLAAHVGFRAVEARLAQDDLAGARHAAREVIEGGFPLTPPFDLVALGAIDLYAGNAQAAHDRFVKAWPQLVRTGMLSLEALRAPALHYRGLAALGAAPTTTGKQRRLLADAASMARGLDSVDTPAVRGQPLLFQAAISVLRNERSEAIVLLAQAEARFETAEMPLYAAAARFRRGQLLGGTEGRALAAQATSALQTHGVRNPERFVLVLAPMGVA